MPPLFIKEYKMIIYRELKKEDGIQINELFKQLTDDPIFFDIDLVINETSIFTIVIEDIGQIIGFGCLIKYLVPTKGQIARLEDIVIDSSYRGKGIGSTLLDKLIEIAKKNGFQMLELTSRPQKTAARSLYLSKGFELRDTGVFRMNLKNIISY